MAEITTTSTQAEPGHPTEQREPQRFPAVWHRLALGGILLIAVFMDFYRLGQNGFDSYYPPAVRSMMDNWHNFFFAAYDPGGFTSLDKPPVGFWLQVISAKLFGFTPFSVLLPQALAGVLSVLLLYYLVRRHFGETAGLLAALALALSPVSVVTNRNVTIDSTLALTMLVGAWAVLRAAETGRLRWLLLCAAVVGIGFNIKMLEAYLVVPAFGLLYLLAAPRSIWMRIGHLAVAAILLLTVSFSWALAVDLTPASQRPHVGSTQDNSEISLALGYNGLQRLLGLGGMPNTTSPSTRPTNTSGNGAPPQGSPNTTSPSTRPTNTSGNGAPPQGSPNATPPSTRPTNTSGNGSPPQGMPNTTSPSTQPTNTSGNGASSQGNFIGSGAFGPSPIRLFTQPFAGQNGWLLPLAILGMIALAWQGRPRLQSDRKIHALILWGMWLLTMGIFFSVAGFIHEYYLTVMAPAIAALCGIGLVTMWRDYRRAGWRGWLLPLALIATAAEQIYTLTSYPAWGRWMIPLLIVLCLLAAGGLLCARLARCVMSEARGSRFLLPALVIGVIALMLSPTLWAAIPILQGTESDLPVAGPIQQGSPGIVSSGKRGTDNPALIRYLEDHQGNAQILVATTGAADGIILATNKSVMPLGGFSSYPLTTTELASLAAEGKLRFLLMNRTQTPPQLLDQSSKQRQAVQVVVGGSGNDQQSAITTWVTQHCKAVPPNLWQSSPTSAGTDPNSGQLYDCAPGH